MAVSKGLKEAPVERQGNKDKKSENNTSGDTAVTYA
jgi:hypothetical protein